jgi:beta-lactamase class D
MNTAKIIAMTNRWLNYERDNGDGTFTLMSVDEFIAYVARVSNPSNQSNTLTPQSFFVIWRSISIGRLLKWSML